LSCRAAGPAGAGNDQADARCRIRARANPGTAGASGAGGLAILPRLQQPAARPVKRGAMVGPVVA